jgi:bifunctional enzyme CysN/CysC
MDERSDLTEGRTYLLKHTTRTVRAIVESLQYRLEINGLHRDDTADALGLNEVGRVRFHTTEPLAVDDYTANRATGSFIIIDPVTNVTAGAGVIRVLAATHASPNVVLQGGRLTRQRRFAALGRRGITILFTGLSGAGKSTIAAGVEETLVMAGHPAYMLDGDNLRHTICGDLGFSEKDRAENVRRAGEVARMFADAGAVALVSLISPCAADRAAMRSAHAEAGLAFMEVFCDTPLDECERRDPKGLYAKARAGQLPGFTGIDAPYEAPTEADLVLRPESGSIAQQVALVLARVDEVLG